MKCKFCGTNFPYRLDKVCARCRVASGIMSYKEIFCAAIPKRRRGELIVQRFIIRNLLVPKLRPKFAEEYKQVIQICYEEKSVSRVFICLKKWRRIAKEFLNEKIN